MDLIALFTAAPAAPYAWSLVLAGAVVIVSIVPLGAARSQADFTMADMDAPRAMFDRLPAWGKRASWAHQNSFESFGLHAPAALLALIAALQTGPLPAIAAAVALIQPALRLIYIGAFMYGHFVFGRPEGSSSIGLTGQVINPRWHGGQCEGDAGRYPSTQSAVFV